VPAIVPTGSSTRRRVTILLASLVLVAAGVACMISAEIGVAPYDVLTTGLSELVDIPIGLAAIVLPVVFVAIGAALGGRLGYGTILCTFLVGPMLGLLLDVLPTTEAMGPRLGYYVIGLAVLSVGITGTVAADIGSGPAELVMLAVHERGPAIAPVRTTIELVCVLVGWAMGGQVGVGTVVFALAIGTILRRLLTLAGFSPQQAAEASDLAAPGA
jgi:uncharacterized membrane protein YczE